ncbi:opa3 domain containing protein [Sporothrix brasiliensis 5110]|uniref:Opa3 domain containing protein n=1 Tax=Sporothrix brasiliensis 5110 TaxID=1398154 RepID=A0A0C2IGZ9_9PEZI|nr:opa3 domain containing protein [Sporothrix brasiliensis 5110]KIH88496.1 opa3 domain containing protein [Sporothrix brasiliensis 5110]
MVALPLFKLGALFVRHISKYGANRIKVRAHEHEGFRRFAARYGQHIHQLNMRMSVALLRNSKSDKVSKEKAEAAEAPTAKTKDQTEKESREKAKDDADRAKYGTTAKESHPATMVVNPGASVWRRKFRPLPESKAVDLFADVVGDGFILVIASALVIFEFYRSSAKPDANAERIRELTDQVEALRSAEEEYARNERIRESRILAMEAALRGFRDPKTKQPLLPPAPTEEDSKPQAREATVAAL